MHDVDELWATWTQWIVWITSDEHLPLSTDRSTAKNAGVSLSYGFSTKRT